ncbi:DUF397 domain-containing protein [Spirillospora sp. NPDC029432]|uniref:DUF397 domain-containing protein n=1 Tax=Spirillospora sp. NPDC029432 TaxID=3154599 RepID=UPI0034561B02
MVDRPNRGAALDWRKSSASGDKDDCVEVAATGRSVLVRDSHAPSAEMLELAPAQWRRLLRHIVDGDAEVR